MLVLFGRPSMEYVMKRSVSVMFCLHYCKRLAIVTMISSISCGYGGLNHTISVEFAINDFLCLRFCTTPMQFLYMYSVIQNVPHNMKWGKVYQLCLHLCRIGNQAYQALLSVLSKQPRLKIIAEHLQQIEKNE